MSEQAKEVIELHEYTFDVSTIKGVRELVIAVMTKLYDEEIGFEEAQTYLSSCEVLALTFRKEK